MFNGHITFEREEPSYEVIEQAVRCAEQLRVQKEAAGMQQAIKGYDLPDGTQVYVVDLSDAWTVHIIPPLSEMPILPPVGEPFDSPILEYMPIIGVASGAAFTGRGEFTDRGLRVINARVDLVSGGAVRPRTRELFTLDDVAHKVGVMEPPGHRGLLTDPEDVFTQLNSHQPGRFTGALASVVQLLLGVGKLYPRDYEARFLDATGGANIAEDELHLLAGDTWDSPVVDTTPVEDVPTIAVSMEEFDEDEQDEAVGQIQLRYDYRWHRTHGICWGQRYQMDNALDVSMRADPHRSQEPFLVEITRQGVFAIPLPRDPASFYQEVREQYLKVYPELGQYAPFRGQTLFEAFGGFPLGASIPIFPEERQRWIRSGLLVQADTDMSPFYSGSAFCTAHGWAFSESGRRAVNVCRKWDDGVQYGECYTLDIRIEQRHNIKYYERAEDFIALLDLTDPLDIYKAYRLADDEATRKALFWRDYELFDALEAVPDWVLSASLVRIRRGSTSYDRAMCNASAPCKGTISPKMIVFEPDLGVSVHIDFSVGRSKRINLPQMDGPVFATFVGDDLEVLNVYQNRGLGQQEWVYTRQRCQFVGQWDEGTRTVRGGMLGDFYSSKVDPRIDGFAESSNVRTFSGRYAGFSDRAAVCAIFSMGITLTRTAHYGYTYKGQSWGMAQHRVSVICASNNRSAYFMCAQTWRSDVVDSEGSSGTLAIGKTGKYRWGRLRNFQWHWAGHCGHCQFPIYLDATYQDCGAGRNSGCGAELFPQAEPIPFQYTVEGGNYRWVPLRVTSVHTGGSAIGQVNYGPTPARLPKWSFISDKYVALKYKVYAMGMPEAHGRVVREVERTAPGLTWWYDGSMLDWWKCSIPGQCPAELWPVLRNYYGRPFAKFNSEIVWGDVVEYGSAPTVEVGPSSILFGVVD